MSISTPLAVSLAGALLIGGAATGTTLAVWQDSEQISSGALQTGNLTIEVRKPSVTPVTFDLGSLDLIEGGAAKAIPAEVVNTSEPGAPNLKMNVRFIGASVISTSLDGKPQLRNSDLRVAVERKGSADCTPASALSDLAAGTIDPLNQQPLGYGSFDVCISLQAVSGAGATGNVTLNFEAVQDR